MELFYHEHEFGPAKPRMRVWRENWFSDQFEVLTAEEFEQLEKLCQRFTIRLTRNPEDDLS